MDKPHWRNLGLLVFALILALVLYRVWYPEWQWRTRVRGAADGQNYVRMRGLYECIDSAAVNDPNLFESLVGRGITTNANALPELLRHQFPFNTNEVFSYCRDTWGRPFNVIVAPIPREIKNSICFNVLVWSSGRNGVNENRAGDDVFLPWPVLVVDVR